MTSSKRGGLVKNQKFFFHYKAALCDPNNILDYPNDILDYPNTILDDPDDILEKNDILEMMLKLNPEQKRACEKVFKFCTESVIAQRLFEKNPESDFKADPLKLIVHGGAGIIN